MTLLAVPNVSEGRDLPLVGEIGRAWAVGEGVTLLDVHADSDHHRSVYTLAGPPGALSGALVAGAAAAVGRIDVSRPRGAHPHVGALDVAPIVHLDTAAQGAACAEALVAADRLASELELPVFLYGVLAAGRTRAQLRQGGLAGLAQRMADGELRPDFGPERPHPTAGVTLVTARPPLVAFNLELAPPGDLRLAQHIAAELREGGAAGLTGLRAIGIELTSRGGVAQVSTNVEDPTALSLGEVTRAVAQRGPVAAAEIVGLVPRAALEDFPDGVPIREFDPARQVIENALGF
ncbi:MAG TPA: hypothetical protein VGN69_06340 [Solirubrobacteraceae bacterium]|jgi:glutamate formiminotransferase/glutamate formiminotransferase/formiminotetrahydrofolate cyclodeaminase|nr:hypothetical protein [Solirubrobacteraceae bacterium]